jgi:nucleoside-diphosphate-sugar epimerase
MRTKWLAEQEVKKGIAKGLPAVILNPTNILGPYAQSWGRLFLALKTGKLPAMGPGSASFCHSREVARLHLEAVTKGNVGDNYLLGGADGTYGEFAAIMAELLGVKPPRTAPRWLLKAIGYASEWASLVTRKEPDMSIGIAELLSSHWRVDCSKAERELGLRPASLRQMTEDTYAWLKAEGIV